MNKLSEENVDRLIRWLRCGLSLRDVAIATGVNRKTVVRYKRALARGDLKSGTMHLSWDTLERLEDVAEQMNVTREKLASMILETVAKEDLFNAVLDTKA